MASDIPPVMIMGVQGAGKSTIGTLLADRLGVAFVDGDRLHSADNVARMAAGIALTDTERMPWLAEVASVLRDGQTDGVVVVCSALKRRYRDFIRESVPSLFIVDPEGPMELVAQRIGSRSHEYMPTELLQSQYDTLEPLEADENGIIVDIRSTPAELIDSIVEAITEGGTSAHRAG